MSLIIGESGQDEVGERQQESGRRDPSSELAIGLQLLRASSVTSIRLQLALARRDRQIAMAALDSLADIDAEIEGLVDRLSGSGLPAPELAAISVWLAEQKAAVARDKFILACDITGPDLVSRPDQPSEVATADDDRPAVEPSQGQGAPELDRTGSEALEPAPARRWWPLVLLALMIAVLAAGLIVAFIQLHGEPLPGIAELGRLVGLRLA